MTNGFAQCCQECGEPIVDNEYWVTGIKKGADGIPVSTYAHKSCLGVEKYLRLYEQEDKSLDRTGNEK